MPATIEIVPYQIAPGKALLTAEQAADYLNCKIQSLANWRTGGRGPRFVRIGRLIRYRLADLDSWIEKNTAAK